MNARLNRLSTFTLCLMISLRLPCSLALAEDAPIAEAPLDNEALTAPPPLPETASSPLAPEMTQTTPVTEPSPPPAALAEKPPGPETTRPPEEVRADNTLTATPVQRHSRIPPFQLSRPSWGMQITYSGGALGASDINASQAGNPMRALTLEFEYQPQFLQSIGVIGIGPSIGLLPIASSGSVVSNPDIVPSMTSTWEVGGQIRYQARYFREQPLVPVVGFDYQRVAYAFTNGPSGSAIASGPTLGLMFLMNILEPDAAAELYIDHAISRSYLIAEAKSLKGSDANVSFSGQSYFFGLRLEF